MAKNSGFLTAAFVSSKALSRHFGLLRGFDVYDDQMPFQDQEGNRIFPERRAAVTTDLALDWLKQHGRQKFFLWVHYYDPHEPYDPPEPYKTSYSTILTRAKLPMRMNGLVVYSISLKNPASERRHSLCSSVITAKA
jgi:hypothetical protein